MLETLRRYCGNRHACWVTGFGLLLLVVALLVGTRFVLRAAPGGAGFAAKHLCSLVYYSKLKPERARALYVDDAVYPLSLALTVSYDDVGRRVRVTGFGIWSAEARMRDGLGCTLTTALPEGTELQTLRLRKVIDVPLRALPPDAVSMTFDDEALERALQRIFNEGRSTLAVVIMHQGNLVADRYAPGITQDTPLPGWSMAKSLTATLTGVLVRRGDLDVWAAGAIPAWQQDATGAGVTLDQLLRMTSGLDLLEDQSGADPNTQMLFTEPDAAAYAADRGLQETPGSHWEYMSGSTVLVARAVVNASGGTLQTSQQFMREGLFGPLGAASFVMEPDLAGTFIGSSFALADAHDWAKLGQLYLNDGVWNGQRLLPENWRDYVVRHTPQSGTASYGAGFWTMERAENRLVPPDIFYASGFQGQTVAVVPSRELVIVRLGAGYPSGIWPLVADVIAALHPSSNW